MSHIVLRLAGLCLFAFILCACQFPFFAKKDAEPGYAKNPCLVLALPASGPYSAISGKIRAGAEEARKELAQKGLQVQIQNINTEASDWITRLAALPEACAVVGGPLQEKSYIAASKAGLLEQRAFFAFMPTLSGGEEGIRAWRFFPGPADQVEALTGFVTDRLNIRTYGAFFPEDNYGRKMTDLLEKNLHQRNIPFQKASYNPKSPQTWQTAVKPLIHPERGADGVTVIPQTMFEALFLPDSWKNIDRITEALTVNGEDRLVLMGTTLWEQGLSGKQAPRAEKYSLAVFPGAWMQSRAPQALRSKNNSFWNALGYDFVNFGAAVAFDMRPEARHVTSRAQKASPAVRGMAPMTWDNAGIAHQQMYLFQVTPSGMMPLSEKQFSQIRTAVSERAALRMQGVGSAPASEPETASASGSVSIPENVSGYEQPAAAPASESAQTEPAYQSRPVAAPAPRAEEAPKAPVYTPSPAPGEGVMSSTPHPSYKLSLPARK